MSVQLPFLCVPTLTVLGIKAFLGHGRISRLAIVHAQAAQGARSLLVADEASAAAPAEEGYPDSVDIFSALHDTVNGEVRIFATVYPESKCGDIKYCRCVGLIRWHQIQVMFNGMHGRKRSEAD
jgi:hypothetical protein